MSLTDVRHIMFYNNVPFIHPLGSHTSRPFVPLPLTNAGPNTSPHDQEDLLAPTHHATLLHSPHSQSLPHRDAHSHAHQWNIGWLLTFQEYQPTSSYFFSYSYYQPLKKTPCGAEPALLYYYSKQKVCKWFDNKYSGLEPSSLYSFRMFFDFFTTRLPQFR